MHHGRCDYFYLRLCIEAVFFIVSFLMIKKYKLKQTVIMDMEEPRLVIECKYDFIPISET